MTPKFSPLFTRAYYRVKPFVPPDLRWALRRRRARRILRDNGSNWPIDAAAGEAPDGWPGWPGGKRFAFALSHDVESRAGLARVRRLAELDMEHGFRSSFNFVPEGDYRLPDDLREWLVGNGFEVGVHDLRHDGKLFDTRRGFRKKAGRINRYLAEWGAVGFRSGFMLRELDWMHDLDVLYDASTFDTDPFEPQPEAAGTIFPYWVRNGGKSSYIELPYTLPQDSTLFILLEEQSPEIWKTKLDWIAERGGLALSIIHPDFTRFEGERGSSASFPVSHYGEFLRYVSTEYEGRFWHALPREVAEFARSATAAPRPESGRPVRAGGRGAAKPKIWVDLDNTPHVLFFEPIVEELTRRGYPVFLTARDAFQVCELADAKGLPYRKIGRHYGKNRMMKGLGLGLRALQLSPLIAREKPALGVSHGARSQLLLGTLMKLPTVLLEDYEHVEIPALMHPTWEMAPKAFETHRAAAAGRSAGVSYYPGIKEDVYAGRLRPDPALLDELGIGSAGILATVRPPATEAHYHNPESERLFERFMNRASRQPDVRVVLLPRNKKQEDVLRRNWPEWFEDNRTVVPERAVDGMNLIWHSDLVVSGGGTMNREAAALGVPVYSIFRGRIGAVDRQLVSEGRLVLVASVDEVDDKILLTRRERRPVEGGTTGRTLEAVVEAIIEYAWKAHRAR